MVHAEAQGGVPDIRQGTGHVPRALPDRAVLRARSARQPRDECHGGALDLLHLSRGGGHLASARAAAADEKRRQPHGQLHLHVGKLPRTVPRQLGVPLLHGTRISPVDRVGVRNRADVRLPRLLLLLRAGLAQQRAHEASGLKCSERREKKRHNTGRRAQWYRRLLCNFAALKQQFPPLHTSRGFYSHRLLSVWEKKRVI
mmetsp:Transcript_8343/g.19040  ORF Transcript_8343/g.19040 Transcript_8343/m.19040 type:complete len:200 (+) Transcript_8343:427-1026(+)